MNQLSGKFVNVVLSVIDGRGMEFVRHPMHVTANYSGRILESDSISPEDRAGFNTELIWEVDKKELRKIRSSNQPLRVECITTDPQNRSDRIGFVLLSLRSAQIIPLKDAKCPITYKWNKLIGCQADKKKHYPELYLALTVRDHLLNDHQEETLPANMPLIYEEEQIVRNEDIEVSSTFPLKYLDDGYIQIGEEEDYETFSLNLMVKEARNLDTLLPEALVFRHNQEKYHMTFKIFGVIIKTKPFYKNLQDTFHLNEKVVVRILASQKTLFAFFNTQSIQITLFNGHDLLGTAEIEMGKITMEEQNARCFFKLPEPNSIVPFGGDEASPFLEIKTWVKRSTDTRFRLTADEKLPTKIVKSNLDRSMSLLGFGDQMDSFILDKLKKVVDLKSKSECSLSNGQPDHLAITQSADTVVKNVPLSPRSGSKKYDINGTYVKYVLHVTLQNLVWKTSPKDKLVIFKFLHPRASNCVTIFTQIPNEVGETRDLKNIGVKVSYVSTIDQIENILNAWPPKLILTDEKEKLLSEEYEFDVSKFFCDEYRSYRYIADLKVARTLQPLARLQVTLNIEECSIGDVIETTDFHLSPPIVDEILSVKEIANLEEWKKHVKDVFERDLSQFKAKEAEKLENAWKEKKKNMEEKLETQMQKCKNLREELQDKVNSIKTDKYLKRRRNHANIFEDIFKENFEKYEYSENKDIIELLSKTQRDNEYLRKLVEDQRDKLRAFEQTTLTREQTTNLLQELKGLEKSFEEAQKTKQYFKDQWQKACDEIHQFKMEEFVKRQTSLQKSREELSHLSLESFNQFVDNKFDLNPDILANRNLPSGNNNDTLCTEY